MPKLAVLILLAVAACAKPVPRVACADLRGAAMVRIPAGDFVMGEDPRNPEEGPPRRVHVAAFEIDRHELTNAEFAAFVRATGYRTLAERVPPVLPGAPPAMRLPGSAVFAVPTDADPRWWRWVVGAQWRHPSGPGEAIAGKDTTPVVQIAYDDAEAYARWAGKTLPTEAQWEYAARAGSRAPAPPEPVDAHGVPQANYYQGVFPVKDFGLDGFTGRAPVGCFRPNRFGLYDMLGNVWEWTRDPAGSATRVIKGGSYLCAATYCARYRPAARQFEERGLGTDHIGVRLVRDAPH